jgi:hypothetical protein
MEKVLDRVKELENGSANVDLSAKRKCRTCFESDAICDGLCWGFWKHSQSHYQQEYHDKLDPIDEVKVGDRVTPGPHWNEMLLGSKFLPSTFTKSKKAKIDVHTSVHSKLQNTENALKTGTVVQIKSWGSGGSENDCVAVLWDDFLQQGRRRRNRQAHRDETKDRGENPLHQAEIYRWGTIARNGQRMYDVKLLQPF